MKIPLMYRVSMQQVKRLSGLWNEILADFECMRILAQSYKQHKRNDALTDIVNSKKSQELFSLLQEVNDIITSSYHLPVFIFCSLSLGLQRNYGCSIDTCIGLRSNVYSLSNLQALQISIHRISKRALNLTSAQYNTMY